MYFLLSNFSTLTWANSECTKHIWTQVKTRQTLRFLKHFCCFYHQPVKSQKCSPESLLWCPAAASAGGWAFTTEPELWGTALEVVLLWLQHPLHLHKPMIPFPYFKYVSWFMWLFPQTVLLFCLSTSLLDHIGPSVSIECLHNCWGEQDTPLTISPFLSPYSEVYGINLLCNEIQDCLTKAVWKQ